MTLGTRVTRYAETLLSRVYMKTLRQEGTRVTIVSIMANPLRALVAVLIALIN